MSESSLVLPYFEQPKLHLGPITIHAFGVLVATGILLAFRLIRRRAPGMGLDPVLAEKLAMHMVVSGFIVAHTFDSLAYYPERVWASLRPAYLPNPDAFREDR